MRRVRRADPRALALLAAVGLGGGRPSTTSVSRRGPAKARKAPERQARPRRSRSRAMRSRSRAAPRLHARGNLLGEEFEQKLGHRRQARRRSRRSTRPGFRAGFAEVADAADVALPLGHRDGAARVHQVEQVRGLQHVVVGRQHQRLALAAARGQQPRHLALHVLELALQHRRRRPPRSRRPRTARSFSRNTSP